MNLRALQKRIASLSAAALPAALLLTPARAAAQPVTFYLDRLPIAGAPEDGLAVWRPQIGPTRAYGQIALGYSLNPLRAANLAGEQASKLAGPPVATQLTTYLTAGLELAERGALQLTLPVTVLQRGSPTDSDPADGLGQPISLAPAAPADLRLDGRIALTQTDSGLFKLGARTALFLPTGNPRSFTGDTSLWGNLGLAAELDFKRIVVALNAGASIRPKTTLFKLTVGPELTYGLAAYLPLLHDRLRLGAEIFGSAGLLPGTAGAPGGAPLEWSLNGRLFLDDRHFGWLGLGAGTRLTNGYAPDFRAVALIGGALTRSTPKPEVIAPVVDFTVNNVDTDRDGVPDAMDDCPSTPDDGAHPEDGCPEPPDADQDGIPDKVDHCPKEPGARSADPQKNGCPEFIQRVDNQVVFKKDLEFEFGKTKLLKTSYPILDELASLLKANPDITRLEITGHTDNAGPDNFNKTVSHARAAAVFDYLVQHGGIAASRLSFEGYGAERPIAPNDTEAGRARNRRVELHILPQPTPAP